jgi:hypothetical protein
MTAKMANVESTTSEGNRDPDALTGLVLDETCREALLVLGWLAWVSGIFGNVLILVTLVSQPSLRCHIYNIYIGNLAVADLLSVGYSLTFLLLDLCLGYHPVVNMQHCRLNGFLTSWFLVTSISTMVLIGFNRYLAVCRPALYARLFTQAKSVILCVGVWVVAAAVACLPYYGLGSYFTYSAASHVCSFNGTNASSIGNVFCVLTLVLPTALIGVFSFNIFRVWHSNRTRIEHWTTASSRRRPTTATARLPHSNQGDSDRAPGGGGGVGGGGGDGGGDGGGGGIQQTGQTNEQRLSSSNLALIRSLLLVFCLLVVLYLPLILGVTMPNTFSSEALTFFVLLLYINHSVNWIVYGIMNNNFRAGYKRLLHRCICQHHQASRATDRIMTGATSVQ